MYLNLPRSTAGKRYSHGAKYSKRTLGIIGNPEATNYQNMQALVDMCVFYYPAYAKKYHKPSDSLIGLPFEIKGTMELTCAQFRKMGDWLIDLCQGLERTVPTRGPNLEEMAWILRVTNKPTIEAYKEINKDK